MAPSILIPPVNAADSGAANAHSSSSAAPAFRPVVAVEDYTDVTTGALLLQDGTVFQGVSFGAEGKSISGECVFQTGMVLLMRWIIFGKWDPILMHA